MKKNIILIILGIVILNIAGAVYFHYSMEDRIFKILGDHFHDNPINPDSIEHTRHLLDLTDGQVEKMREIDLRYSELEKPYRDRIRPLREKLRKNIHKETFDDNEMRSILERIDRERRELRILTMKQRIEMGKLLSPEQKEKFRDAIKKFPGRFKRKGFFRGHKGRHGKPPPPPPHPMEMGPE